MNGRRNRRTGETISVALVEGRLLPLSDLRGAIEAVGQERDGLERLPLVDFVDLDPGVSRPDGRVVIRVEANPAGEEGVSALASSTFRIEGEG